MKTFFTTVGKAGREGGDRNGTRRTLLRDRREEDGPGSAAAEMKRPGPTMEPGRRQPVRGSLLEPQPESSREGRPVRVDHRAICLLAPRLRGVEFDEAVLAAELDADTGLPSVVGHVALNNERRVSDFRETRETGLESPASLPHTLIRVLSGLSLTNHH